MVSKNIKMTAIQLTATLAKVFVEILSSIRKVAETPKRSFVYHKVSLSYAILTGGVVAGLM